MRSFTFLSFVYILVLLGLASAGPYGADSPHGGIVAREDTTTAAEKATTGATATSDQSAAKTESATDDTSTGTKTGKATGTTTGTQTGKSTATGKGKSSKSGNSTSTSIDPRDGVGGVSMLNPPSTSTTYFKVGDYITFEWKYTSLQVTPSAVNVVASCSKNSETYTLSSNMSVSETGKVVWDTAKYQANATVPLLTATYTLYVYDTNATLGDTASAGHLGSQIGYNFGLYTPQSYTPLNEYICATCNGALTSLERNGLKFAVGMAAITVASFTWFANGFGAFST
ncbi:hypothetical protein BDV25DRAFT_151447 [Aspergillus avenaceus]|uniref:DUF7137 domain-containing protein n=1 Tax=Aspergillus avenaceus TaxID=36643 RepID=A0A5N6U1Q1_ASPAV|nr:hypothetical protein BDV25DRAFT_151447 [Aspergillus avenaceus]